MKCQILFSGKNKKNISKCRLLKILPRVLSVKQESWWNRFYMFAQMGVKDKAHTGVFGATVWFLEARKPRKWNCGNTLSPQEIFFWVFIFPSLCMSTKCQLICFRGCLEPAVQLKFEKQVDLPLKPIYKNFIKIRDLINSIFGVSYSNFSFLTPTFLKVSIDKYGKTPTFSGGQHFTPIFKILVRTL